MNGMNNSLILTEQLQYLDCFTSYPHFCNQIDLSQLVNLLFSF